MKTLFMCMLYFVIVSPSLSIAIADVNTALTSESLPDISLDGIKIRLDDLHSYTLFPDVSAEAANMITTILGNQDLKGFDYFSIQGCVTTMIHDVETILDANVNETMVRNYVLLCLVIDIRLMDEEIKQFNKEE